MDGEADWAGEISTQTQFNARTHIQHLTHSPTLPTRTGPHAIQAFFDAAAKDPSMIKGAWVLMLEADYVW